MTKWCPYTVLECIKHLALNFFSLSDSLVLRRFFFTEGIVIDWLLLLSLFYYYYYDYYCLAMPHHHVMLETIKIFLNMMLRRKIIIKGNMSGKIVQVYFFNNLCYMPLLCDICVLQWPPGSEFFHHSAIRDYWITSSFTTRTKCMENADWNEQNGLERTQSVSLFQVSRIRYSS